MKTKTVKKEKPAKKIYTISITQDGKTTKGTGATALEALQAVVKPIKIVSKVFLTITDGTRKAEMMYMPVKAKRLFYPIAQVIVAKQFEYLMK